MKNQSSSPLGVFAVRVAAILLALVLVMLPLNAQAIVSPTSSVNLSYVVGESITVTGAPPSLTFAGSPTPTTGALTVTTSWNVVSTRTHVDTNLFFSSPTAAMTDGASHNIPANKVLANFNGGAFSDCGRNPATDTAGVAVTGATCNVGFGVAITTANLTGSHSDAFVLQLDTATVAALPAGTYTGVLNIVAGVS